MVNYRDTGVSKKITEKNKCTCLFVIAMTSSIFRFKSSHSDSLDKSFFLLEPGTFTANENPPNSFSS